MINAKELRISNIVFDENKNIAVINGFRPYGTSTRCDEEEGCYLLFDIIFQDGTSSKNWTADIVEMSHIPLTEEWLLKFGFEKEPMAYSRNIDLFGGGKKLSFSGDYLYLVDSEKKNTTPTDIITIWNKDVIKQFYVHQLQNLYFALTGEELTIK